MTDKFTKGPWKLTQQGHWPFSLITRAADDRVIAFRELASDNTSDKLARHANARSGNAEVIANETLRAAAPELLEALRYARRFLKPGDHDTAYVDAVIAKALSTPAEG
ncbi:hypothetical protein ACHMW5_13450 [Azospirillum melinis]|uniref:hypothetical protein n=1 Tax=Azospirillum melinis TaxID=328839 RepID=UPI0037568B6B